MPPDLPGCTAKSIVCDGLSSFKSFIRSLRKFKTEAGRYALHVESFPLSSIVAVSVLLLRAKFMAMEPYLVQYSHTVLHGIFDKRLK